jgi:hypothetical protein
VIGLYLEIGLEKERLDWLSLDQELAIGTFKERSTTIAGVVSVNA